MSYIIICTVALLVSALTLFFGFGLGTLLMPAFALFFPLEVAIAATAIVHLANNLFKVGLVGRKANAGIVLRFALPAAITAMIGALSGFFGGLSGHQGALRTAFLIRAGLPKEVFVGTMVVSAVVVDLSRLLI